MFTRFLEEQRTRYRIGRRKIPFFFSPANSAAAAVSSALGVAARARVFLEPSTRGRAFCSWNAHARTPDDAIQSPGMLAPSLSLSLVGGLHGPDTINVLRPTSRTKTRGDERGVPGGRRKSRRAGGLDGGEIEKDKFIGS